MTESQKLVLLGLIDGKTYSEIGREMGISRQAAHEFAQHAIRVGRPDNRAYYPNLSKWITDNFRSVRAFCIRYGLAQHNVGQMLSKGREPSWRIVKRLCEITGMTAEELMAGGKSDKEAQETDEA